MIKIGITGSIASGKSSVANIICRKKIPLFCADKAVHDIYKNKDFQKKIKITFGLKSKQNIKNEVKTNILSSKAKLKKLESIIHPIVRKKMNNFIVKNKKKKLVVLEIPLLFESKLSNKFNIILFVDATKKIRMKRYLLRGGNRDIFTILNNRQIKAKQKKKKSDYTIKNNYTYDKLKKNVVKLCTKFF